MNSALVDILSRHARPLEPRPTDVAPKLQSLDDIRAVLFDVYGTLFISASGDIGLDTGTDKLSAIQEAAAACQLSLEVAPIEIQARFEHTIRDDHLEAKAAGTEFPEVDIVDVWRRALRLDESQQADLVGVPERFAIEYEVRVNPVWPMPQASETLVKLRDRGSVLGIVSNAQFFTPLMFPALLGQSPEELGFEASLSYFSYENKQAKPGNDLYRLAARQLAQREISPGETLYVGNDMLNDITAASSVGFRTALFAGDARSLRWRADDERVKGVTADIVITSLAQLLECLQLD